MLLRSSKAITTLNFYLRNVAQFVTYFRETKPPLCRLSATQIIAVQRCILKALRDVRKQVVLHQVEVKRVKMLRVVTVSNLQTCHKQAKLMVPRLLGEHMSNFFFFLHLSASPTGLY